MLSCRDLVPVFLLHLFNHGGHLKDLGTVSGGVLHHVTQSLSVGSAHHGQDQKVLVFIGHSKIMIAGVFESSVMAGQVLYLDVSCCCHPSGHVHSPTPSAGIVGGYVVVSSFFVEFRIKPVLTHQVNWWLLADGILDADHFTEVSRHIEYILLGQAGGVVVELWSAEGERT